MARHIHGPLYYERTGRSGPVMAFVHPNPMDQSCWLYQTAHFSTWYRCLSIDIPGYGRSPKADPGLALEDIAEACWEAIDDACPSAPAILLGCSIGAAIATHMHNLRPHRTRALIVCGIGYSATKEHAWNGITGFRERGLAFRKDLTFEDFGPAFRATPMAHYFADLFSERNDNADLDTIIHLFEAMTRPDPEGHHAAVNCPVLILTGSEDPSHQRAFELKARVPGCELNILAGAGHACQMEQPWLFDRLAIEFLVKHGLFPVDQDPVVGRF